MIYTPRKSRILNRETIKSIEEIDQALDKGLAGIQAKTKRQK